MEQILIMDAKQAEKERDEYENLLFKESEKLAATEVDKKVIERHLQEMHRKCQLLLTANQELEDKCVWGLELEQV